MAMTGPQSLRQALPGLRRTLTRFGPYIRKQRRLIAGGSTALLFEIVLRLAEPWPLKFILDRVIQPSSGQAATGVAWADALAPQTLLLYSAVGIVVVVGLRALAAYLSTVAFALAGNRVLTEVRALLYGHLQRLSLAFHSKARTGDLITRITSDVGRLQEVTVTAALPFVANIVTLLAMAGVMLWVNAQLALIALLAFPPFLFTMSRLTRKIRTVARKQRLVEGALASTVAESLGAMKVVQSYRLEERLAGQFAANNAKSLKEGVQGKRLSAGLERKTDVLVAIGTGLVLFYGARLVLRGQLTPGDLIVFTTYLKNAFKPMRDAAKYTGRLAKAAASGERIIDVLDQAPDIVDAPDARRAPWFRGDVRLEGVTFGYEPGHPILRGLDLHATPGQRIALVGPSGAGKSSIASLLLRLYDPWDGRVVIDGHDVRDLTLASLRDQVAIVLQDSVLFATTIRENIAYGAVAVTDDEIVAAARLANAHDFILALPEGYDTVVGERGATLSGGQRQRIAIARAAVRDARIVVLDEAMAGLDRPSEAAVATALQRLTRDRTTFVVSHDIGAVSDADQILYIDGGVVVDAGRHEDLLVRLDAYRALHAARPDPVRASAVAG